MSTRPSPRTIPSAPPWSARQVVQRGGSFNLVGRASPGTHLHPGEVAAGRCSVTARLPCSGSTPKRERDSSLNRRETPDGRDTHRCPRCRLPGHRRGNEGLRGARRARQGEEGLDRGRHPRHARGGRQRLRAADRRQPRPQGDGLGRWRRARSGLVRAADARVGRRRGGCGQGDRQIRRQQGPRRSFTRRSARTCRRGRPGSSRSSTTSSGSVSSRRSRAPCSGRSSRATRRAWAH